MRTMPKGFFFPRLGRRLRKSIDQGDRLIGRALGGKMGGGATPRGRTPP